MGNIGSEGTAQYLVQGSKKRIYSDLSGKNQYSGKSYDRERVKNAKIGSNWISKGQAKPEKKSRVKRGASKKDSEKDAEIPVDYDDEDEGGTS